MSNIIAELEQTIKDAQDKIRSIQNICTHPKEVLSVKRGSFTGGYDRNDEYWTDYECLLCGKKWRKES